MADKPATYSRAYLVKGLIFATLVISLLGYVDYITGEISIDILYLICICLVTWYTSTLLGILCVAEILIAKTSADYLDKIRVGSHLYEWDMFNHVVMYIIVCVLVGKLKKALTN